MTIDIATRFGALSDNVLSAILDQSRDCIKLISCRGELEFMNINGRKVMEIEDFSAVAGADWAELWPEESRDRVREAVRKACDGESSRFEGYCPTAAGTPRWWDVSVSPVRDSGGTVSHILSTSRDVTKSVNDRLDDKRKRKAAEARADHSDDVAHEMRHRLKNQLAVISALSRMVARHAENADDYRDRMAVRIAALSRAQDLVTRAAIGGLDAATCVDLALSDSGAGDCIELGSIPACQLDANGLQNLSLILGELQTNSLKYGAMSKEEGQVVLSATRAGDTLSLHWHEHCGVEVTPPETEGSGTQLIRRLGSTSQAQASVEWHVHGPQVHFHLAVVD